MMSLALQCTVIAGLFFTTAAVDIPLDCLSGWTNIGVLCYRAFSDVLPWESAHRICQSYGSQLVKVKDYYENADVGNFATSQALTEYWIGSSRQGASPNDERSLFWSDGTQAHLAVGYWQNYQPNNADGQCILVSVNNGNVLWSFAPCEKKTAFVCQRPAAPAGSFHCVNGNFIRQGLTCDGEDDCGDGSDELNCSSRCTVHIKQQRGIFSSPNWPNSYPSKQNCIWLIEVSLGYCVRLQFTDFDTESRSDEVRILVGGLTQSESRLVARLSGSLRSNELPAYTSNNNFMMVIFTTDNSMTGRGFEANFTAVRQEGFSASQQLTGTSTPQSLYSPLYPQQYLSSQDYTWVITAEERVKIVTLEIIDVDLRGDDRVLIRDGNTVLSTLIAELTSTYKSNPSYVLSTGRNLYITMQTRGLETGRGFHFRFWQGCQVQLTGLSGEVHSPGYRVGGSGQYGAFQVCTYNITPPVPQPVTVVFSFLDIHRSDEVMIYEGNVLLYNVTGTAAPPPFEIPSGLFRVVFDSDAILTGKGFSLKYSVDCLRPVFNNQTLVTPPFASAYQRYGDSVTVSCVNGYSFSAMEFQNHSVSDSFKPLSTVTLTCLEGGVWNFNALPVCEPKYCGQAPRVTNAYVLRSTGVTYQKTVTYACYVGFAMHGSSNITCSEDGTWTPTPSCQTAACSSLPEAISHGVSKKIFGNGTSFNSIVSYDCDPGYQIVGKPILLCNTEGTWTSSVPTCEVLKCLVPTVRNGTVTPAGSMVDVGKRVTITCNSGYVSNAPGGSPGIFTCGTNRTLVGIDAFKCSYQNKCVSEPAYCTQLCTDSEANGRTCSCKNGYALNADGHTCDDLDECANKTSGCQQLCKNIPGGYECHCKPGYALFTYDGAEGFRLAHNEDGLRKEDERILNHTCVPVKCPDPLNIPHGSRMVDLASYHYGDSVEYFCELGYTMVGKSLLKCLESGTWDNSPPSCNVAQCPADTDLTTPKNPAVVSPTGPVNFSQQVNLTCRVPGRAPVTKNRQCVYYQGKYTLFGASYECGLIDCGQPQKFPGSVYQGLNPSNTTYGAAFTFTCENFYTPRGSSEKNDSIVRCSSNGRWDFGDLRCDGIKCLDPGTPPGGSQIATSYSQGALVYFRCNRAGFTLSSPYPIVCQLNASRTGLEWNSTIPTCVDTKLPSLAGCIENKTVALYSRANDVISLPTATDNAGVSKFRVTEGPVSIWPSNSLYLNRDTYFTFTATDFNNNTNSCTTRVMMSDVVPPTIQCPADFIREFYLAGEVITVEFNASIVTVSDNRKVLTPLFRPSQYVLNVSDAIVGTAFPPFVSQLVTASVEDSSGNMAKCDFELFFRAANCSSYSMRTPLNGQKYCSAKSDNSGFQCVLSCNPGYVFYEQPNMTSLVYECNKGDSWQETKVTACVRADNPSQEARFRQTFRFNYTQMDSGSPCNTDTPYRTILEPSLRSVGSSISAYCILTNNSLTGTLVITKLDIFQGYVLIDFTLTYDEKRYYVYTECKKSISDAFTSVIRPLALPLRQNFSTVSCPTISGSSAGLLVGEEFFCLGDKRILYKDVNVCIKCPEGTRDVNGTCELCPRGTYNSVPGSTTCLPCPASTSTLSPGAVSVQECSTVCGSGMYSSTGLHPCRMCPKNTFSVNSTYCGACPNGYVTRTSGATSQAQCLAPCPNGTYNEIDGHGNCTECPYHYYSDKLGNLLCTPCASNQKTLNKSSTSASSCEQQLDCILNNACLNGGTCGLYNHVPMCTCPDGYNGEMCQDVVDGCTSNPCYNGGSCSRSGSSYTCICPSGATGARCEAILPTCAIDTCLNGSDCRNDLNTFTCLCPPGFTGSRCGEIIPVCTPNPCQNGGSCLSLGNLRYRCECPVGFEGENCTVNIDDCLSNPCLHGSNCTDLVNSYQCTCPPGRYVGQRCETRVNRCQSDTCSPGVCVEDHVSDTYRCVCPPGTYYGTVCQFEAYFGFSTNGTVPFVFNATNVAIRDCLKKCEDMNCTEVLYDNSTALCQIVNPSYYAPGLRSGMYIYYYRQCYKVEETYWTPWYDSFLPTNGNSSDMGDFETLSGLRAYGLNICGGTTPIDAQCLITNTSQPPSEKLFFNCTATDGLLCVNSDQPDGMCENYEIRFRCLSTRVLSASKCEDITYCNSSYCLHNGVCTETPTGSQCACQTGYTGSRCQLDVDDCRSVQCQNSGSCHDMFMNYTCVCPSGFTGRLCETNIDDCQVNNCSVLGSANVTDRINRCDCNCKPGYTGERCEIDIDECQSQPCLHLGTCQDLVNGFRCNCTSGWSGTMCEVITTTCQRVTCHNGAQCYDVFDDFYCSCLPNTYGKNCSNAPSICANVDPCLHRGMCSEMNGVPMCQCPDEYLGSGCEILKDFCNSSSVVCQNGATCVPAAGNFTCSCKDGYSGRYCEKNTDDCSGNPCPPLSTCVDMINSHFCRCPVLKSGDKCDKDTDLNFDLQFSLPSRNNMAALAYPLHLSGSGFSITMWIQYLNQGGQGTFFTLFQVPQVNSLEGKRELLRLDEVGLVLSLDGTQRRLDTAVDYSQDGEWHYIVLSWNRDTNLFSFFVDTVRATLEGYAMNLTLDMYTWMVLGCRYNADTDTCVEEQGFNGIISQVSFYNRELKFRDELTLVGISNRFHVFPNAIMTWGEFLLYPGVNRIYPSLVDASCRKGFTNYPSCTTPTPGKQAVTVKSCPNDIIMNSSNRVTPVHWTEPAFKGGASIVSSSLASGSVFLWGKYPIVIEATNRDGNKALCSFDIYVQYDQCSTPSQPANAGQVFCANFIDSENRNYRQCSLNCPASYTVVVPSPSLYTCGPVGSWDPPRMYLPFTLPSCGATSEPKRRLKVVIVYHVPSPKCDTLEPQIYRLTIERIIEQNGNWSNGLCQTSNCSDLVVNVTCTPSPPTGGRRKRQPAISDIFVTIIGNDVPKLLVKSSDPSVTLSPEDLLQQLILSDFVFDFSKTIADAVPDPNGLIKIIELLCPRPLALTNGKCVQCVAGSFYDSVSESCVLCEIGKFQNASSMTSCDFCSNGTTTEKRGATSSRDCKKVCNPGSYYDRVIENCAPCPQGFYQNVSGRFYCLPCPVDKTTRQSGAVSEGTCFNDCPPGEELTENGTCTECKIGFYKPAGQTLCGSCNKTLVTNYTKSDDISDCNVADNPPGYIRSRSDETKLEPCPIGTYQPLKWQYDCISCGGDNYRTDQMASTSIQDCKFFCPAGQQQVKNATLCEPCGIGYYRTGANPYSPCELCPNNTRTASTGSLSVQECTIYKCPAGERPLNQTCERCPRGYYQPKQDQEDCIQCPPEANATRKDGAKFLTDCETYCPSGFEKLANGSCSKCPIGYFKNNSVDVFQPCTRCSNTLFVTRGEGSTSEMDCTVLNCTAGQYIDGIHCNPCARGTFQELPYQSSCLPCPSGTSTRNNGSRNATDCETFCPPGQQKNSKLGTCEDCARGYYKNNSYEFMDCTLCPEEYVTPYTKSVSIGDCTVRNCTPGQYISGSVCKLCDLGFYQEDWWQHTCIRCDTDRTTQRNGAVNKTECILSCPPGKENRPSTDNCTLCERGYFKVIEAATQCIGCPAGYITATVGATNITDCNIKACNPGEYGETTCTACAFGTYQNEKWQKECKPCPNGFTTFQRGANSSQLCLRNCSPGFEYLPQQDTCEKCPIGYYNDKLDPARFTCISCPDGYITENNGSTSTQACNIRNCTKPGQYRSLSQNECVDCPLGWWQDQKWQTACISCGTGYTTQVTGAKSQAECIHDCPNGETLVGDVCTKCGQGFYRNKTESWQCQQCPSYLTTAGNGSTSVTQCSIPTCVPGTYFNYTEKRCVGCSKGYYQDTVGQDACKICPDFKETSTTGASSVSMCVDKCSSGNHMCNLNAKCSNSLTGVTCECNDGYIGNGITCTHICNTTSYCKPENTETCNMNPPKCVCKTNFQGVKCDEWQNPNQSELGEKNTVIVAVITTLAFALFVIMLVVCCCLMARKRQRQKIPFANDFDERGSIATRLSTRFYDDVGPVLGNKSLSMATNSRMMLPSHNPQMFENPTYTYDTDGDPAVYKA